MSVGRANERRALTEWLQADDAHPVLLLHAPGGRGKSALVAHWLHSDVPVAEWPHVVWWTAGHTGAEFERFMAEALACISGVRPDVARVPSRTQVGLLLRALRSRRLLLILDGVEQLSPLADLFLRRASRMRACGRLVITSRVLLPASRVESLPPLSSADALGLFQDRDAIQQVCDGLSAAARALLARLACMRVPVAAGDLDPASVNELITRGLANALVSDESTGPRIDLQREVRRVVYDRLSPRQRTRLHAAVRDRLAAAPLPTKLHSLNELAPVIELFHHMIASGQRDAACFLANDGLEPGIAYLMRYGHCCQCSGNQVLAELLAALVPAGAGRRRLPRLKKPKDVLWTLERLASAYFLCGQPRLASATSALAVQAARRVGPGETALSLFTSAMTLVPLGSLREADAALRRSIAASQAIGNVHIEAVGRTGLGALLSYCGDWTAAESEIAAGLEQFAATRPARPLIRNQGGAWSLRAQTEIFRLRSAIATARSAADSFDRSTALAPARRTLELADEWTDAHYALDRDYVRAHLLLGAAHRLAGMSAEAEQYLRAAFVRCRRINMIDAEAQVLTELALLHVDRGSSLDAAERLAAEALRITERADAALPRADVQLAMARVAIARGQVDRSRVHATEALRLAEGDGPPRHRYAAAHDEATALLQEPSCFRPTRPL